MTIAIARLKDAPEGEARARWLGRFVSAAAALRSGEHAAHAPSPGYTDLLLRLAAHRPHELLVALDGERVRGRLMATASLSSPSVAVLGLFEVEDGPEAGEIARQLVRGAEDWATEQGRPRLYAPVDINSWFSYRFPLPSTAAGAPPPFAWEPASPPTYLELFRRLGYEDAEWYHTTGATLSASTGYAAPDAALATAGAHARAVAAGYRFERLESGDRLDSILREMHSLCMAAFRDNPLFEPLPLELFELLYTSAAATYDCTLSHWARDTHGTLVGFVLAFVDGGTVVIKTIAVAPELRGRRLSTALVHLVLRVAADRGHETFVSALVRRGNTSEFLSEAHLVPGLQPWRREYVLLGKRLSAVGSRLSAHQP